MILESPQGKPAPADLTACSRRLRLDMSSDVLERARTLSARLGIPFKRIVNEALRAGLDHVAHPSKQRPCRTESRAMGLKPGRNLDDIQELLAQIEGEDSR